jgi:hypothetical protein
MAPLGRPNFIRFIAEIHYLGSPEVRSLISLQLPASTSHVDLDEAQAMVDPSLDATLSSIPLS